MRIDEIREKVEGIPHMNFVQAKVITNLILDNKFQNILEWKNLPQVACMPQDEKSTPQIRKVYELLVKHHPAYGEFMEKDEWAYARKTSFFPKTFRNIFSPVVRNKPV